MLYVPNFENGQCPIVYNNETIRVYSETPRIGYSVNYTDYYVNSHYMKNNGVQNFGNYSTIPTCLTSTDVTTNFVYRNDLTDILLVFIMIVFITLYPIYFAFKRFNRGRKVF